MTKNIEKTKKQIDLIKEKINESSEIINIIEFYTSLNNEDLTSKMLFEIKKHCEEKLITDF
jgi:hypothetical protein